MTNTFSTMSCETLYQMYKSYVERLEDLISGTRTALRNMTKLVAFPFNRLNALIDEYLDAIANMGSLLDFSNINKIVKALQKMLDCPLLVDMFGQQIADILANIGKGTGLIKQMVLQMLESVADTIRSTLEPIKAALQAPFNKATALYDAFVKGTLAPIMQFLHDLEECLELMCAAYKAVRSFDPLAIVKPLKKFGIEFDKEGHLKTNKGTMLQTLNKKWTDMKDRVSADFEKACADTLKRADKVLGDLGDLLDRAHSLPEAGD